MGLFENGLQPFEHQDFPGTWASQQVLEKSGEVTVSPVNPLDELPRPDDN